MIPTTWFRCNRAFSRNACSDKTQTEYPSCCKVSTFCIFRLRGSSWKRLVFAFPTTRMVVSLVTATCGLPPKAVTNACACFRDNVSNLPVNTIFSPRNLVSLAFPLSWKCSFLYFTLLERLLSRTISERVFFLQKKALYCSQPNLRPLFTLKWVGK